MDPKIIKLIHDYLSGTLNAEDKQAFEAQLQQSTDIQEELELQQSIQEAAARASQRTQVKDAAKRFRRKRMLRNGGISALIAIVAATAVLLISNRNTEEAQPKVKEIAPISNKVKNKLDENQDFDNIPIQYFQIPSHGSVQLSDQGVLISVPKGAFLKNGKPYMKTVILQYQEAIKGIDIVKSGLNTMTGNDLLETQGMFSVAGYTEKGEILNFNPEVGVYIQSPVDECKNGMRLYDGKKDADGNIDWVDPKPLSKIPVLAEMSDLDFYPSGYNNYLNAEKWNRDKKSRDSFYLSLENTMDPQAILDGLSNDPISFRENDRQDQLNINLMGQVFSDKTRPGDTMPTIDDLIAWDFTSRPINKNLWEVTASAVIRPGFHVYSSQDADPNKQTQIKITPYGETEIVDETKDNGKTVNVRVEEGFAKGFVEQASFTQLVEINSASQVSIPVRVVFSLANDNMGFSRVIRRSSIILGQSEEDRSARLDSIANVEITGEFILPSNVMSFWKPAFNGTNLSTREFERRMRAIHQTCDNKVLELYTGGLDQSISEIDQKVVGMGYPKFQAFADENVGKIELNDPHLIGLNEFYEKAQRALKKDAANKVKTEEERLKQWSDIVNEQREMDKQRSVQRNQLYVDGVKNFNRKNLVRQLRTANGFRITSGSFGSPIARRNCDRWRPFVGIPVAASAEDIRTEPTQFITAETSKYNAFSVTVKDADAFVDVYMYLFADGVNSYQRIKGENGTFKCQLNDEIKYAIGIVGITEDGYAYYEHDFLKEGDLGTVNLKAVSEAYLESRIEKMNGKRLAGNINFKDDLKWLRTQRVSYKVQRLYKEMITFRREVKAVIFPCMTFTPLENNRAQTEAKLENIELN